MEESRKYPSLAEIKAMSPEELEAFNKETRQRMELKIEKVTLDKAGIEAIEHLVSGRPKIETEMVEIGKRKDETPITVKARLRMTGPSQIKFGKIARIQKLMKLGEEFDVENLVKLIAEVLADNLVDKPYTDPLVWITYFHETDLEDLIDIMSLVTAPALKRISDAKGFRKDRGRV